jgi:hypothetical protein
MHFLHKTIVVLILSVRSVSDPSVLVAGAATDSKQMNRVEAQSPNQSNQQQSTHNPPQQTLAYNIPFGFYYPGAAVLPGAASFQYPTMFPVWHLKLVSLYGMGVVASL